MGYQMQNPVPNHFTLESDTIKLEPSPIESPLSSLVQTLPARLPSISAWYDDSSNTRRPSTTSLASSWALISEPQSPVDPIGDLSLHERATRRLSQLSGHFPSPYPSPGSTPGPEEHIVMKSKTKAKTRSVRGVTQTSDDASKKDLTSEEVTRMKVKATREQEARLEQSQSLARAWQECLITNPNFIREGVTRDGRRGLRQLKRNNINERIEKPNEVNKDQLTDLNTMCHRQLREINIRQIENHRLRGRYAEASALERELRGVGTHL
ncbi:hypothetical protein P171DRAFT_81015 [Karstenula rhodostoma CBS 690.94]|uniref:Uncharacterized protein n=1 Tax=Karstenula rhodostoma CBS 690.94 TaxID=1392251 RepID=A0A9P4U830_9PLEO|nr:hypothetical protein P171DRAFT_81015 [Karstenula rhodostoma CBS 690.94]